jgi:type II secretory pathway component PulL
MIMVDPRVLEDDEEEFPVEALVVDALAIDHLAIDALAIEAIAVEAVAADVPAVDAVLVDLEPGSETERHLRVAPDSVKRRRHVRIAATAAVVSISATLFAVVGFNVELAQHQIQLQKLEVQLQAEQAKYYDLRGQVAQSSSPSVISREAKEFGLVKTAPSYLGAQVRTPAPDSTGTLKLPEAQTGSSLAPVQ